MTRRQRNAHRDRLAQAWRLDGAERKVRSAAKAGQPCPLGWRELQALARAGRIDRKLARFGISRELTARECRRLVRVWPGEGG